MITSLRNMYFFLESKVQLRKKLWWEWNLSQQVMVFRHSVSSEPACPCPITPPAENVLEKATWLSPVLVTPSSKLLLLPLLQGTLSCRLRYCPIPLAVTLHISTLTLYVLVIIAKADLIYLFSKLLVGVGVWRRHLTVLPRHLVPDSNKFGKVIR